MRSNDVWLGMPYDVFCFTGIQMLMAGTIGCQLGTYTHNVGSMHLYDKNAKAVEECFEHSMNIKKLEHRWDSNDLHQVAYAVKLEESIRVKALTIDTLTERAAEELGKDSMLADLVRCCARKRGVELSLQSDSLTKGFANMKDCKHG
jgi:thymidylate synthase